MFAEDTQGGSGCFRSGEGDLEIILAVVAAAGQRGAPPRQMGHARAGLNRPGHVFCLRKKYIQVITARRKNVTVECEAQTRPHQNWNWGKLRPKFHAAGRQTVGRVVKF